MVEKESAELLAEIMDESARGGKMHRSEQISKILGPGIILEGKFCFWETRL